MKTVEYIGRYWQIAADKLEIGCSLPIAMLAWISSPGKQPPETRLRVSEQTPGEN